VVSEPKNRSVEPNYRGSLVRTRNKLRQRLGRQLGYRKRTTLRILALLQSRQQILPVARAFLEPSVNPIPSDAG
jgi:hypothetical protein